MSSEILSRNVKKETNEHYKDRWPFAADARRNLYLKYANNVPKEIADSRGDPFYERTPRDMWAEVAQNIMQRLGETSNKVGLDVGSSSGYFAHQLFNQGYKGRLLGVDIEIETQHAVEAIIKRDHPDADFHLGMSDAQQLRELVYVDENNRKLKINIPKDHFDFVAELFVMYHVPSTKRAYAAAHRVAKPDGLVVFSGRGEENQKHLWTLGRMVADELNLMRPESFYEVHSLDDMEKHLNSSPYYEVLEKVPQAEHLWIPNNEEGWLDFKWALLTLPYGRDKSTGKHTRGLELEKYISEYVRPQFERQAEANGGYFIDYVFQNYYMCRAVK